MTQYRVEEDLLGPMDVPADAYYGVHTQRALENFQISDEKVQDVPEMVRGIVMVKKASALANLEKHTIPRDVGKAIIRACDLILDEGRCMNQFPIDALQGGAGTSLNMNANEVVANLALEVMGLPEGPVRRHQPERPRQQEPVDQRRLPLRFPHRDVHAHRDPAGGARTIWPRRSRRRAMSSPT